MPGVLLYGGSFNPVHVGHLIVSRSAAEQLDAEHVALIPSAHPPHKTPADLAPVADRCAMCNLAVAGDPLFEVNDWETRRTGPNYTLHTVRHFREALGPTSPLYWLVGADSLAELHTWHRVDELLELCTIVTARRPGPPPELAALRAASSAAAVERVAQYILTTPQIEISATEIRRRVRAGRSIRHLVPEAVERYIAERGLYRTG